jgi:hypothetical protein
MLDGHKEYLNDGGIAVELRKAFCYFSPIGKGSKDNIREQIKCTEIKESHDVYIKLLQLLENVKKECDLNIIFTSDGEKQNNSTRDMLLSIIETEEIDDGIPLVEWLSLNTDNKSKSGLVFIIIGSDNKDTFILIARFPAEEGMVINDSQKRIKVKVIDEVFLKNSHRYKMAFFEGESKKGDFWKGLAVDRQINDTAAAIREASEYWIKNFLKCTLEMTSKRGSIMVAKSFRQILNSNLEDIDKQRIIEAAIGAKTLNGKKTSISKLITDLGIEDRIGKKIIERLPTRAAAEQVFHFDIQYFTGIFNLRVKYLNTGAVIIAPNDEFEDLFQPEKVAENGLTRYTTEGITTNETVKAKV